MSAVVFIVNRVFLALPFSFLPFLLFCSFRLFPSVFPAFLRFRSLFSVSVVVAVVVFLSSSFLLPFALCPPDPSTTTTLFLLVGGEGSGGGRANGADEEGNLWQQNLRFLAHDLFSSPLRRA
jgi:hypothetical protein